MNFNTRIAQQLHVEHVAVIALLERLQKFVSGEMPDTTDPQTSNFLGDLKVTIEGEITNHFKIEEDDLFPILIDEGDGDMTELLCDDHDIILPLGMNLVTLIKENTASGFSAESWQKFKQFGSEFADRLIDHASKEEIGLVPMIDELLVAGVDADLAAKYIDNR